MLHRLTLPQALQQVNYVIWIEIGQCYLRLYCYLQLFIAIHIKSIYNINIYIYTHLILNIHIDLWNIIDKIFANIKKLHSPSVAIILKLKTSSACCDSGSYCGAIFYPPRKYAHLQTKYRKRLGMHIFVAAINSFPNPSPRHAAYRK